MKTKNIFLGLIAIAALYFSACQKSLTFEDNTTPNAIDSTANPDSNYLSKIFFSDTTFNGGNMDVDTSIFVFNYDNNKRLKTIVIKEGPNSTVVGDVYLECFYNLNDSLPYKTLFPSDQSTYYFFYDNAGRLIKDSINNIGVNAVQFSRNLTYSSNMIFAQVYKTFSGTTSAVEKDTFSFDTRGNMISSKYYFSNNGSTYELASSSISTFDNNPSPFLKTPSYRLLSFTFGTFNFEAHYNNFGTNNILVDIYNRYPFTGSGITTQISDTSSAINTLYQNGLLKNVKSYYSKWTYFYKSF